MLAHRLRRWANISPALGQHAVFAGILRHFPLTYPRNRGGGPRVVVSTAAFHARHRGSVPGLGGLNETKNVSSPSTCETQYCEEPPWPRGSVLGLRPPGREFRIVCLEDSVISFISPSSGGFPGPVLSLLCAQRWPKARIISFHLPWPYCAMSVSLTQETIHKILPMLILPSHQTRDIETLLLQCWATVYDAGQTLKQQWLNVSWLLGWPILVDSGPTLNQHWMNILCVLSLYISFLDSLRSTLNVWYFPSKHETLTRCRLMYGQR